jgi:hypothetical protein
MSQPSFWMLHVPLSQEGKEECALLSSNSQSAYHMVYYYELFFCTFNQLTRSVNTRRTLGTIVAVVDRQDRIHRFISSIHTHTYYEAIEEVGHNKSSDPKRGNKNRTRREEIQDQHGHTTP